MIDTTMDDGNRKNRRTARRRFLKISSTGVIVALAGCSSEQAPSKSNSSEQAPSKSNSTSNSSGSENTNNSTFSIPYSSVPTNLQWNPYVLSNYATVGAKMVFDPLLRYNWKTDTFIPYVIQKWERNGKTLTAHLREDDTWHNGDNVTAHDVVTKFKMEKGLGRQAGSYIDEAKAVDKQTVKFSLPQPYQSKIVMNLLAQLWMDTPANKKYGDFVKRFDKASSDKERQNIQSAIQDYQPNKPLGSGPFKYNSADNQKLELEKYNQHPDADKIKFDKFEIVNKSTHQQMAAALKNGQVDSNGSAQIPQKIAKSFPDHIKKIKVPTPSGYGLAFNHTDEDFKNRKVRQALAYVIDPTKIAKLGESGIAPITTPVGVAGFHSNTWKKRLGGNVSIYDKYNNADKAAKLLKNEGYTKKNGQWHKPNGEQFTLTIRVPSGWHNFVNYGTIVSDMLTNFGIKTNGKSVESTAFTGQYLNSTNFKIIPYFWNGSNRSLPFFSLAWILTGHTVMDNLKYEKKPKVPPMGEPDAKATPTDVRGLFKQLGKATDDQKATKITRQLAWVVNQSLPMLPLIGSSTNVYWNTKQWNVPPKDTKKKYVRRPYYWWPHTGLVSPKQ